jgi:hypothetical protein
VSKVKLAAVSIVTLLKSMGENVDLLQCGQLLNLLAENDVCIEDLTVDGCCYLNIQELKN